jgi:hypothetical protein
VGDGISPARPGYRLTMVDVPWMHHTYSQSGAHGAHGAHPGFHRAAVSQLGARQSPHTVGYKEQANVAVVQPCCSFRRAFVAVSRSRTS